MKQNPKNTKPGADREPSTLRKRNKDNIKKNPTVREMRVNIVNMDGENLIPEFTMRRKVTFQKQN